GAGVARGYLGRAAATAEKFVPHPFSSNKGERLYRTGDLARHRSDGVIEFLGRIDDQVKIHGYRIEPEEVAAILRTCRAVKEAVVIAREDQPGEKRLVAYVVSRSGQLIEAELKQQLAAQLLDYMLPKAIITLPALALTL